MTRIVFYINVAAPAAFLRRFLHRKVFLPQLTGLIYAPAPLIAELDETLWDDSFLPHEVLAEDGVAAAPIMLASSAPPPEFGSDILVSLAPEVPDFASSFPTCVEILANDEASRQAGRRRYGYFREHGYPIEIIDMGKKR